MILKRYENADACTRCIWQLKLGQLCFQRSGPVQINSTAVGRGLLEWFSCHEDNIQNLYPDYRSGLLRDWREEGLPLRRQVAEEDLRDPESRHKRWLTEVFREFHTISFQIHDLKLEIRMLSNPPPGVGGKALLPMFHDLEKRLSILHQKIRGLVYSSHCSEMTQFAASPPEYRYTRPHVVHI